MWNYGSYGQLVGFLERIISPLARPLPTQDSINLEEKGTDIHASSGRRTHDPSVQASKTFHALDRAATVIGCLKS
jgi:hypothetical protein